MSYASNLKSGASVDLVVPDHLRLTVTKLEHHAYKLRMTSKDSSGGDKTREIKTQARINNVREGMFLGVRKDKDSLWQFYQPDKLPKLSAADQTDTSDPES